MEDGDRPKDRKVFPRIAALKEELFHVLTASRLECFRRDAIRMWRNLVLRFFAEKQSSPEVRVESFIRRFPL